MIRAFNYKCSECSEPAVGFTDDGDPVCEDCAAEWFLEEVERQTRELAND